MRRRNQRDSRGGTSPNSLANIEALVVNRDRNDTATAEAKHLSRKTVPRLLHPNTAVRIKQYATRNRQGLLGSADNHDLVCLASHRARRPNVCCDYLAQFFKPQGIAVIETLVRNLAAVACHQCVPYAERKLLKRDLSHTECTHAAPYEKVAGRLRWHLRTCRKRPWSQARLNAINLRRMRHANGIW